MTTALELRRFKAPRWIHTEAGQWAYESNEEWRRTANQTFGVEERRLLLNKAEAMHNQRPATNETNS
ncbi:hypothetical protein [Candidatus Viridilinea mediisalina]|uniref:Uncharacterized protein n=1 Tax=Candidatus Viridilinea mediisalina TaxID=2024553 RepID=A0A2A6RFB0_9CHLR|nr:hypothetical protein [Candidatus Viridilinea mediisalina]PDW01767.1 hypothetical protein CJ255_17460 [Candidatus Viridilinea mediisalina]